MKANYFDKEDDGRRASRVFQISSEAAVPIASPKGLDWKYSQSKEIKGNNGGQKSIKL